MKKLEERQEKYLKQVVASLRWMSYGFFVLFSIGLFYLINPKIFRFEETVKVEAPMPQYSDDIVDGIHVETGLVVDDGWELVRSNCTGCHSSKLILQNRMTRDAWKSTIVWMQETQNLWPLGRNEKPILDYLEKNCAPVKVGRRQNVIVSEWYEID